MKKIDKQWYKEGCSSIDKCNQIGDCTECKNVWKAGWKAALEWVLTGKFEYNPKYGDNTEVVLANGIEKELKE